MASGVVDKLVRHHPHVFVDPVVSGAAEVATNGDAIKAADSGRASVTKA